MATNPYMSQKVRSEQSLYEDLIIEAIQFYGQDVYYLPRELVNVDPVFMDDVPSHFSDAYKVEMYIENTEGFDGETNLFTKFGIELRDQATFVVARRRWRQLIGDNLTENQFRPREGDIIYLPMSHSMFEIKNVQTETPFYQINQLPLFRMQCELFEYSDEDFDTGIDMIDDVEQDHAFQYEIQMIDPETIDAELQAYINAQGQVTSVEILNGGSGYTLNPIVTVEPPAADLGYFGANSLNVSAGRGLTDNYTQLSPHGSIEFFIKPEYLPNVGERHIMFITGGSTSAVSQRMAFGYNDQGTLLLQLFEGPDVLELDGVIQADTWNHLAFFAEDQVVVVYVNGYRTDTLSFSESQNFISAEGFSVGLDAAGTIVGVEWKPVSGWIDEFRAQVGIFSQILEPRLNSDILQGESYLVRPEEEFVEDNYTAYLAHWNGRTAVIELVIDNGTAVAANIVDAGNLYNTAPSLEVSNPGIEGMYQIGEEVTQIFDSYEMRGEVTSWNSETLILKLAHNGATDGKFHTWTTDSPIYGEKAAYYPAEILEGENEIQINSQNIVFEDFGKDFIDWSENNPFGEVK